MLASLKIARSRRRRSGIPACSQQISYALSLSIWTCVGGLYGMCSSFVRRCLRLQEVKSGQSNLAPRRILDSHIFFSTFSNSAQRFVTTGGDTTHPVNQITRLFSTPAQYREVTTWAQMQKLVRLPSSPSTAVPKSQYDPMNTKAWIAP